MRGDGGWWLVDTAALDTWRLTLETQGMSANTASARVYAVRTLLSVALRDGIIGPDQARNLGLSPYKARRRRDEKPVGRRLTVQECAGRAVDVETNKDKHDLAILDCMLYLGLRRAEVAALRVVERGLTVEGRKGQLAAWLCDLVDGMGETERTLEAVTIAFRKLSPGFR